MKRNITCVLPVSFCLILLSACSDRQEFQSWDEAFAALDQYGQSRVPGLYQEAMAAETSFRSADPPPYFKLMGAFMREKEREVCLDEEKIQNSSSADVPFPDTCTFDGGYIEDASFRMNGTCTGSAGTFDLVYSGEGLGEPRTSAEFTFATAKDLNAPDRDSLTVRVVSERVGDCDWATSN